MDITYSPAEPTVFGLPAHQGRWLLIPLGVTVLLCLGTVYSWSVFRRPLELQMGISATASLMPFTLVLVCNAVMMPITGFYMGRFGTRRVAAVGGAIVGLGYLLASLATQIETLTLAYGVVVGIGVGMTYGVPMAVVARWFPDRKGLAVGLTIIGFGLSPLVTAPLANHLIATVGVRPTLRLMGIAFGLIILAISLAMKLPPPGWHPYEGTIPHASEAAHHAYPPQMMKSRSFYGLWICYTIGTLVGLTAIGISSPVGQEIININPGLAASSVALFALFNGISRPLFGWLSDRFRPHQVAIASYSLILLACVLMVNAQSGQVALYLVAFCLFWFCLGGWLAIAPTTTLRLFNPDHYAQNYGIVFTAYGVGALVGTLSAGQIRDWFGSYTYAFYPMAVLAMIGIVVAATLLKPDASHPQA